MSRLQNFLSLVSRFTQNREKNFICLHIFCQKNEIFFQANYLLNLDSIKPQKCLSKSPPDYDELYENYKSFLNYKKSTKNEKILNYWNHKHLSIFLWIISVLETIMEIQNEKFNDEHWELIAHMLPYTTKDSLKYKWISLKKEKGCDNLWSQEDDMLLVEILREKEPKLFEIEANDYKIKWSFVAMEMNQRSTNKIKEWMGKHCRERWFNHLNPYLKRSEWSVNEDIKLMESAILNHRKWAAIAKEFPGRNQHSVKNRFLSLISREFKISRRKLSSKDINSEEISLSTLCSLKKRQFNDEFEVENINGPFKRLKIEDEMHMINLSNIDSKKIFPNFHSNNTNHLIANQFKETHPIALQIFPKSFIPDSSFGISPLGVSPGDQLLQIYKSNQFESLQRYNIGFSDLLSHCLMKSPEHDGYAKYEDICDSIGKKPTCTTLNSIEEIEPCDEMRI